MRKIIVIVLCVCLLSVSLSFASTKAPSRALTLSFSGTSANCKMTVENNGAAINATMELWQGTTKLHEWTDSGTGSVVIEGNHSCVSGISYELRGSGTINGVPFSITPVVRACP